MLPGNHLYEYSEPAEVRQLILCTSCAAHWTMLRATVRFTPRTEGGSRFISKARAMAFEVCIIQIYSRNLLPDGYRWHRMLPESQSEVCILQIYSAILLMGGPNSKGPAYLRNLKYAYFKSIPEIYCQMAADGTGCCQNPRVKYAYFKSIQQFY